MAGNALVCKCEERCRPVYGYNIRSNLGRYSSGDGGISIHLSRAIVLIRSKERSPEKVLSNGVVARSSHPLFCH